MQLTNEAVLIRFKANKIPSHESHQLHRYFKIISISIMTFVLDIKFQSKMPYGSPLPAGHLLLRSIICESLTILLHILTLQNCLCPTQTPSTILYTKITTHGNSNIINICLIKSSSRKVAVTIHCCCSHICSIYLYTITRRYVSKVYDIKFTVGTFCWAFHKQICMILWGPIWLRNRRS